MVGSGLASPSLAGAAEAGGFGVETWVGADGAGVGPTVGVAVCAGGVAVAVGGEVGVGNTSAVAVGMEVGAAASGAADGLAPQEQATSSPASARAVNIPVRVLARIGQLPGRLVGARGRRLSLIARRQWDAAPVRRVAGEANGPRWLGAPRAGGGRRSARCEPGWPKGHPPPRGRHRPRLMLGRRAYRPRKGGARSVTSASKAAISVGPRRLDRLAPRLTASRVEVDGGVGRLGGRDDLDGRLRRQSTSAGGSCEASTPPPITSSRRRRVGRSTPET